MRVVFLSAAYPPEMQQYTRGLAEVGAEVYGVGDQSPAALPPSMKKHLAGWLQVPRIMDEDDVIERVTAPSGPCSTMTAREPVVAFTSTSTKKTKLSGPP